MSNIKKKLRAIGAKVRKSKPAVAIDPTAALNANMGMFLNAQGAFLASEIAKAREEGVKLGAGIDAAESLRLLAVENAEQRSILERLVAKESEWDLAMYDVITTHLAKPRQRFVLKADASGQTESIDSPPAAVTQAPESAPPAPVPHDAPPADARPDEAAPLPH